VLGALASGVLLGGSTLHSLLGSQRAAKSAVNVDEDDGEQVHDRSSQGRARGAVDARHGAAVPSMLAEIDKSQTSLGQQLKPIANKSLASAMPCELWLRFTSAAHQHARCCRRASVRTEYVFDRKAKKVFIAPSGEQTCRRRC
jgi:hypothetical protein